MFRMFLLSPGLGQVVRKSYEYMKVFLKPVYTQGAQMLANPVCLCLSCCYNSLNFFFLNHSHTNSQSIKDLSRSTDRGVSMVGLWGGTGVPGGNPPDYRLLVDHQLRSLGFKLGLCFISAVENHILSSLRIVALFFRL